MAIDTTTLTRDSNSRVLDIFSIIFVTILILSNIMAQKLFVFFGYTFTTAIIVFPVSYILGDVLTEVWGYATTRRVIWNGFLAAALVSIFIEISIVLPPADGWKLQSEYAAILGQVPRTVVASLIAYLCGEFTNSYVLARMKLWTGGKYLWTRTIGSTVAGQLVDTTIFVVLAFVGLVPLGLLVQIIWSAYLFKVLYESAATPITYAVVAWVKRVENIDVYDRTTNFNPFRFR
jgi:uncharacterized integral membrane protein (TIGR00697 family)